MRLRLLVFGALAAVACARPPATLQCPATTPEAAFDLVSSARLSVSETGRTTPYPWVLEETQAVATLRDDDPATGWLLPVGHSSLQIDWQPWMSGPVSLSGLRLSFDGPRPRVSVQLDAWCGGPTLRSALLEGTSIDLGQTCAGCVTLQFDASEPTSLSELHLETGDARARPASIPQPTLTQRRSETSGIVEGFYGVPWSWREREYMVATLAANGLGTYIYAPKNDPLHRDRWRTPYPPETMEHFRALQAFATARGVRLSIGISPFLDFDARGGSDEAVLLDKMRAFVALGVTDFVLLADDIEQSPSVRIDGALGELHATVANHLLQALREEAPGARLTFVPTVYNEARIRSLGDGLAYLQAMKNLDASIGFMWTGNETGNASLSGDDLSHIISIVGRSPIIWDNFYANDGGDGFQGRLFLAPYSGRTADLMEVSAGIVNNMSIQGGLSRLAVSLIGDYFDHPETPDTDRAHARAAALESTFAFDVPPATTPASTLPLILGLFDTSSQTPGTAAVLRDALAPITGALSAGEAVPLQSAEKAFEMLGRLAALQDQVRRSSLEPDLVDELFFPLDKVRLEAEAGLDTMQLLVARQGGSDDPVSQMRADETLTESALRRFSFAPGLVQSLYDVVVALPGGSTPLVRPEQPLPTTCRQGQSVELKTESGSTVGWFGVSDDPQRAWTPAAAGEVSVIVEATTSAPAGLWWARSNLVCAPN